MQVTDFNHGFNINKIFLPLYYNCILINEELDVFLILIYLKLLSSASEFVVNELDNIFSNSVLFRSWSIDFDNKRYPK